MILIERQRGRVRLQLQFLAMGADGCVIFTGGDRPHLGAVAVGQARESLAHTGKPSATVSNITLPGHKEDDLARSIAARLAAVTTANIAVCCGIHLDAITAEEITAVQQLSDDMLDELLSKLTAVK